MTVLASSGPTAQRAAATERALATHEPHLVPGFAQALPRALSTVSGRVLAAAHREGFFDAPVGETVRVPGTDQRVAVRRHAFGQLEFTEAIDADPAQLLAALTGTPQPAVEEELRDATLNLAVAYARRAVRDRKLRTTAESTGASDLVDMWAGLDADEQAIAFERLATEGHNLHPCGRTRLGWGVDDVLAHDLESPMTTVKFLAVRRDLHVGDDLSSVFTELDIDSTRYAATPVHPWQHDQILRGRYADLAADGSIMPLDVELRALVTAALRTVLVQGTGHYLKLSLDIQVTSTRRTISVASTRNGPALSGLLPDLMDDDRVLLLAETGGSAVVAPDRDGPRNRDIAAILRQGLSGRLHPGEVVVPGIALPAASPLHPGRSVVGELVDRFARTRGVGAPDRAASHFLAEYARLLLPPVLALMTRHGIGLEAHLQNCLPSFVDGVPHRLALRDFAGMRIDASRLAAPLDLWPGSVIVTTDVDVLRAKVAYTALQAHLGEIVASLAGSHGLNEAGAWSSIRACVDEVYAGLAEEPGLAERARADHAFLTARTVPHKALLLMRCSAAAGNSGDHYVDVENPLI